MELSEEMYEWARQLFPICRSITGPGVRQTLEFIKDILPDLQIKEVASGTEAFDWIVPDEWQIRDAHIKDELGNVLVDFKVNNLHIMGYSIPVDGWLTFEELDSHLYSLPDRPDAIPYITSYYKRDWGFCLTQNQRNKLKTGKYRVFIDSELKTGVLNYAELILPGDEKKEIFISTYVCHPSMANNELSGPVIATALARWISSESNRRFTYRFVFIPETIGSVVYLSKHHNQLKQNVIAGFNLTCVGDDRVYSFMPSIDGDTLADRVAMYVLVSKGVNLNKYSFLERGSDERQYCWPGIGLPVVSIMRSKYGTFPEYHTSDDNLDLISPSGLLGALNVHIDCIKTLELNHIYTSKTICEPNLGRRGLYPTVSTLSNKQFSRDLIDFLVYCDGKRRLLDIAILLNKTIDDIIVLIATLEKHGLIEIKRENGEYK
jgi:aminopeptidase-like protein